MSHAITERAVGESRQRLHACVRAGVGHFEPTVVFRDTCTGYLFIKARHRPYSIVARYCSHWTDC